MAGSEATGHPVIIQFLTIPTDFMIVDQKLEKEQFF